MRYIKLMFFIAVSLLAVVSCKEDPLPVSKNQAVVSGGLEVMNDVDKVSVSGRTATLSALVNNEQNREITECGVFYSTTQGFSEGQSQKAVAASFEDNAFAITIDNLIDGKTYYYYFYVRHSGGLSFSEESSFDVPEIISEPLVAFDENSIVDGTVLYGVILSDGHKEITEIGIDWSLSEGMENSQTIIGNINDIIKEDDSYYFSIDVDAISNEWVNNGSLYFRIYAKNDQGTGYSEIKSISRPKFLPKYKITKLWVTGKTTAKMEIECILPGANLSSYGYIVNGGTPVALEGNAIEVGERQVVELTGLKDGDNKICVFGVNDDGTSLENSDNTRNFSTKILDKYDSNIRYFELEPIEVTENGVRKYCYFLDRNLGAKKSSPTDNEPRPEATEEEAGGLFQWGRNGRKNPNTGIAHSIWDSELSPIGPANTVETVEKNHYYKFITSKKGDTRYSWIKNYPEDRDMLDGLWNDTQSGGTNNPCPSGYRVPTNFELQGFFAPENKGKMNIVLASRFRAMSDGTQRTGRTYYWSCKTKIEGDYVRAYVWLNESNNVNDATNLGNGCFVRPVRVEVIDGE